MEANKAFATTDERYDFLGNHNPGQSPWNACVIDMRADGFYWFFDYNNIVNGAPTLNFKRRVDW